MCREANDRKHRAIIVEIGSWSAEIDEEIAPLIREMWIAGIETFMSCQEDGWGKVWINFLEVADLVRFLNIVAEFEAGPNTLYNRMNPNWRSGDPELDWIYDLHPDDLAFVDEDSCAGKIVEAHYEGAPGFFFTFSVRFPPSDLPKVLERMQRFNGEAALLDATALQSGLHPAA